MNQTVHAGAGERVVLTGATGFLGQEILRLLIKRRPETRRANVGGVRDILALAEEARRRGSLWRNSTARLPR